MVSIALAFLAGVLAFQHLPVLPAWWVGAAVCVPMIPPLRRAPRAAFALLGFAWAWAHAAFVLDQRIPEDMAGRTLLVTGTVEELPEWLASGQRFLLRVEHAGAGEPGGQPAPWRGRARLSWRAPPAPVAPGQRCLLRVRLFPPNGFRNPGGFDYERWLYANRVTATGYVLDGATNRCLEATGTTAFADRVREQIRMRVAAAPGSREATALFNALVIGDRSGFDSRQWEVFRATGTGHLVAISGLHLGFVAGLAMAVFARLWRRSAGLCRHLPAPHAGALGALAIAATYALLAGLSLPTQRALAMLAAGLAAFLLRRNTTPRLLLAVALLAVLVLDPSAVLSGGFWLSFAAVAVIFVAVTGTAGHPRAVTWLVVQWSIALGLMPVLAAWGLPVAGSAPLVNLVAVPWFTLVIVPLALTSVATVLVAGGPATALLDFTLWLLSHTYAVLDAVASAAGWVWNPGDAGPWALLLAGAGVLVLLLPLPLRLRSLGMAMLLPLLLPANAVPEPGSLQVAVLDVGQGLATVVRTPDHTLVYDLGPRYSPSFNAAEAVVRPFLESRGIRQVDRLILSHDDADHVGAWQRFLDAVPVGEVLAGQPETLGGRARGCRRGERWRWDGVLFEMLHPGAMAGSVRDNEASCVLRVVHPAASFLFTGDITRRVERQLAAADPASLRADFVVLPHHGSRSSSSAALVSATRAHTVLVSAGYLNRYGFPAEEVVSRWREAGARVLGTAASGALLIEVPAAGQPHVTRYRQVARRYWHR